MLVDRPNSVRIGGLAWLIEGSDLLERDHGKAGVTYWTGKITVDTRSPDIAREANTLLHELFHAIEFVYAPGNLHATEGQIMCLAAGLWQVLADNPGVREYLWAALETPDVEAPE